MWARLRQKFTKPKVTTEHGPAAEAGNNVVVSPSMSGFRMPNLGPKAKIVIPFLLIPLLVIALVIVVRHLNPKPALQVSGFGNTLKVSQSLYQTLLSQAKAEGILAPIAKETIIKAYKYQLATQHTHLVPTQKEITAVIATNGQANPNKPNDWQKLNGYIGATDNLVHREEGGGYEGAVLYYPYDYLFVFDPPYGKPDHFGEPDAIAEYKTYALNQATADRDALLHNKTTVDAIIKRISKDPKLQLAGGYNESHTFSTDLNGVTYINGSTITGSVHNEILTSSKSLKKPGVSDIQQYYNTFTSDTLAPGYPTTTDVAYYFVSLSKINKANPGVGKQFDGALQQIKVVSHV